MPYRIPDIQDLKQEIKSLQDQHSEAEEQRIQKILDGLADDIKAAAANGKNYFHYDVSTYDVWTILGFRPRVKRGTFAERVFNKLVTLGFEPRARKGPGFMDVEYADIYIDL